MHIQDKEPCFEESHTRNADECFTCKRPTPMFPEWIEKLEAAKKFKAYVHKRLDEAGIPHKIDDEHLKNGCRIGGRLDFVISRKSAAEAKLKRIESHKCIFTPPTGNKFCEITHCCPCIAAGRV